jgi:hypothetical protein
MGMPVFGTKIQEMTSTVLLILLAKAGYDFSFAAVGTSHSAWRA